MKRQVFVILIILTLLLSGCSNNADELSMQGLEEIEIVEETKQDVLDEMDMEMTDKDLEENLVKVGFEYISGQYSRKVTQDEVEYTETIALDKNSFLRITRTDMEQEVYAYNYKSDDFTYLYYFKSELLSKTKFNIETGAVIENEEGYAELLSIDAQELKLYFSDLMDQAGIKTEQLIK